jgi:hypothetical protein
LGTSPKLYLTVIDNRLPWGIRREMAESPLYGAILRNQFRTKLGLSTVTVVQGNKRSPSSTRRALAK